MIKTILYAAEIRDEWRGGINKEDLAKWYGLTKVDCAIPQTLFDQLATETFHPWSHYVYDYSTYSFGVLFPLTQEGMARMEEIDMPFNDPRKAG
jgi:hypothetical protein